MCKVLCFEYESAERGCALDGVARGISIQLVSWEKPSTEEFSQPYVVESDGDERLEIMSLWVLGFLAFTGVKIK